MLQLLRTFIELGLFRGKPQDLPTSDSLLITTALFAFATYFAGNGILAGTGRGFAISLAQVALLGAVVGLILRLHRKRERWKQVMIALYGVSALLHLVALPPVLSIGRTTPDQIQSGSPLLLLAAINLWFLFFTAVVLREALEISMPLAFLIGFVCDLVVALLLVLLFGPLI